MNSSVHIDNHYFFSFYYQSNTGLSLIKLYEMEAERSLKFFFKF